MTFQKEMRGMKALRSIHQRIPWRNMEPRTATTRNGRVHHGVAANRRIIARRSMDQKTKMSGRRARRYFSHSGNKKVDFLFFEFKGMNVSFQSCITVVLFFGI